jgi:dienelactone hydrolase
MRPGPLALTSILAAVTLAPGRLVAQEAPSAETFRVLDAVPEGPRITPFLRHQLDRAWAQDEARRTAWNAVRTEADLRELQDVTRRKLLAVLGGLPETKTPLNARVVGAIPMEGYRIEKIVFESLPGLFVTALVYLPDAPAGPKPAVLLACGHSPLGKAYPPYQEIAARLARRGYVVLCWDPVGQGERSQYWDAARGRSRYNLVCGEHAVLGNLAVLAGFSIARWMAWDGIRAVDYLQGRPEVDGSRISITGTSGGGFQSTYVGALDERVRVVAPSCFISSLPMRMANRIFEDPDTDPEQDPYGLVSEGIDHPGLLLLAWPRPVHVAAAVKDFYPIEGARRTVRELAALYERFGHGDRLVLKEGFHGHQYSPENQESAFAFLDRFNAMPVRTGLPAVRTLELEALRCTPSGQVRVDLGGRSLSEVIRDAYREKKEGKNGAVRMTEMYQRAPHADVGAWPVVPYADHARQGAIAWAAAGSTTAGNTIIDRYQVHHGGGLVLPILHIHRRVGRTSRIVLDFGLNGKAGPGDWAEIEARLKDGFEVVSLDPRGLGETRMRYRAESIDDPTLAAGAEDEAYTSPISGVLANHVYNALLSGRPYVFEMVEDVEIAGRFAREKLGARSVAVSGRGEARVVAALAAEVLPGIEALSGRDLSWWRHTVEDLGEDWPIALALPGGAYVEARP